MRITAVFILLFFLLGNCSQKTQPDESKKGSVSLVSSIEPKSCAAGETITLKILLESTGDQKISEPRTAGTLEGFQVISRSISKQINYINGKKTEILEVNLILLAIENGTWTIPGYEVTGEKGRIYKTEAIEITVSGTADPKKRKNKNLPEYKPAPEKNGDDGIFI